MWVQLDGLGVKSNCILKTLDAGGRYLVGLPLRESCVALLGKLSRGLLNLLLLLGLLDLLLLHGLLDLLTFADVGVVISSTCESLF